MAATLNLSSSSASLALGTSSAALDLATTGASVDLAAGSPAGLELGAGEAGAPIGSTPVPDGLVAGALVHRQNTPAATWHGLHPFARMPDVTTYVDGEEVDTTVEATPTSYVITWPEPTAGVAIIR